MREEANTARNLVGQLNALIAEMDALEDQGELFDTLMDLRDDREAARTKLEGLNGLITQAEQEIETKEAHVQAMNGLRYGSILNILQGRNELLEKIIWCVVDSGGVSELDHKSKILKAQFNAWWFPYLTPCTIINPILSPKNRIMETEANDLHHLVNYDNDNDIDDLGYESKVYLDEEEEEDENNHSNGNVIKRGITRLSKFRREYGKPDGIKLSVTFDALNRISGSHNALFLSFLRDLVREQIGFKILSWKKVGSEARDKLWDEITRYFDVDLTFKKLIKNKEIKLDEEPLRGIMWLKGRVNKDGQFPDDKIRSVGDKLKETEDKIKDGTLKVDHDSCIRQASDERIALLQSQLDNERRER
ncbi:hypothetical protein Tco_0567554 [Tanacetum coccineum]